MANEEVETSVPVEDSITKKGRHRKKQLYNSILKQMEFYFSDSNLSKDRFLSQLTKDNAFVDLSVFLQFNKIRKLTSNCEDIKKALRKSQLIQISEDGEKVGRKEPLKIKTNVDECTIYVERLKSHASHEWLHSVFSEFGNVVYSSIPKYKHNSVIKGFAFIEFEKAEEAEKALNFFESIGCRMPANFDPEDLCSIRTFEDNTNGDNAVEESVEKKRKLEQEDEGENKKIKLSDVEDDANGNNKIEEDEGKKKKKLKKEQKKKAYMKELGLQLLSKNEWKKMRNRYLDLQRRKMKEFKKHLNKAKYGSNYSEKSEENQANEESTGNNNEDNDTKMSKEPKYEFVPGLIVKVKLKEAVSDFKKPKAEFRLIEDVQYVEVPHIGSTEIFLRFGNAENAKKFNQHPNAAEIELLQDKEEENYWQKIQTDREDKIKRTQKKQRGRDKLLKKAKHYKFDD